MKKLSVVVPVYYNEVSLPLLFVELQKVEEQLARMGIELELVFVDDGSGDSSFDELQKIKAARADTKLIKLTRNFGGIHAMKTGLRFVTGDCFLVLAADLQDPPELIPKMAALWLEGSKYVVCAREGRVDPFWVKIFAKFYYVLVRFFVVADFPAGGFDLALMDGDFLPHLRNSARNINPYLFAFWLGYEPVVISYKREERIHGRSRWTFSKKLKLFLDTFLGFSIVPIRAISAVGIGVSLMSFGYGLVVVFSALLGKSEVPGFAALATLVTFLLGLMIVMLGIIGEYIWRIFDQVNAKPEAVIESVH